MVEKIDSFRGFFCEYQHLPLIGIQASLAVKESMLYSAEKQRFVMLAVGDQVEWRSRNWLGLCRDGGGTVGSPSTPVGVAWMKRSLRSVIQVPPAGRNDDHGSLQQQGNRIKNSLQIN